MSKTGIIATIMAAALAVGLGACDQNNDGGNPQQSTVPSSPSPSTPSTPSSPSTPTAPQE